MANKKTDKDLNKILNDGNTPTDETPQELTEKELQALKEKEEMDALLDETGKENELLIERVRELEEGKAETAPGTSEKETLLDKENVLLRKRVEDLEAGKPLHANVEEQPFWRYHKDKEDRLFKSKAELAAAGEGWADNPQRAKEL